MNLPRRILAWLRAALGLAIGGSAVAASHAQQTTAEPPPVTYRLTWFELQITPFIYRFAIQPNQPILIGIQGENGAKGDVILIRRDHVPEVYDRTIEQVDALVRKSGVMQLTPVSSAQAYADAAMKTPGVHLRIAYADNTRWAAMFPVESQPPEIATLIADTKALARELLVRQSSETIDGDKALEHLHAAEKQSQHSRSDIVLKLRISLAGVVAVNGKTVTLDELGLALDVLKEKNGTVWYFREAGATAPSPETHAIIKQVLNAVMARKLPIKLQEQEY